ncbi:MAG: N-acetyltransferase family protein [Chitinophagaceae bacterium]
MVIIRTAIPSDAAELLSIYRPYIENTSITFETETPSLDSFAQRIENYLRFFPWLVCEVNGRVAGYAYAARHRERTAYQWSVESSVYVHEDYLRAGVAAALYTALFEIMKRQGIRNVYAVINLPNDRSVAFHEKLGFRYFATYEQVGYKLGKWKNVGWWRLVINDFTAEPDAPINFSSLDKNFLPEVFERNALLIKNR